MSDPTEFAIIVTFCSAVGVFALGALFTLWRKKHHPAFPQDMTTLATTQSVAPAPWRQVEGNPYRTPGITQSVAPLPLEPPIGKVPVFFYRPLDLVGLGMIISIFFVLTLASIQTNGDTHPEITPSGLFVTMGFQFFMATIATVMVVSRIHPIDWLGLKWKSWPWVFLLAPATVIGMWMVFGGLQAAGYMRWMKSLGVEPVQEAVKLLQESNDPIVLGLMAFTAVIVAPLCEELVFRGYLYPVAKRFSGPWIGGLFSAVIFGCAHGNLTALLPLTIFGVVLVVIYEKTGSLWASIAVHFCFNGATVLIQALARHFHIPIDGSL